MLNKTNNKVVDGYKCIVNSSLSPILNINYDLLHGC